MKPAHAPRTASPPAPQDTPLADRTPAQLRIPLAQGMARHAAFDGWTLKAAEAGARDIGIDPLQARLIFPAGATDMIAAYVDMANQRMTDRILQAGGLARWRVQDRIARAVQIRLDAALPEREAVRRALAFLAQPRHALLAARLNWTAADAMWRAAGDQATDYNHYTKRLILGGVYASTLLVWLDDDSPGFATSCAFLHRRIQGVLRFEKVKARLITTRDQLPSLARFLGRLRYPAS